MSRGIIIGAPASGSGKTTLTLGLLKALRERGVAVASAKVGPDYIDPAFHSAASGRACHNLDTWTMRGPTLERIAAELHLDASLVVVEGVMGLFDGAPDGRGSTADLSRRTGWPVVLVVDAAGMAASAAAVVHGFASYDRQVVLAGVIFNRVGSRRHGELLEQALAGSGVPVLGCVPRNEALHLPDRHLGLVQAREHADLETFLDTAAKHVAASVDLAQFAELARPIRAVDHRPATPLPPLGQRIAVAHDDAFAFCYAYLLDGWRRAGAQVGTFSPLADEPPPEDSDAVYLPGGYPELHAERLAAATRFTQGLGRAARRGALIYGECGGFMVLGTQLTDKEGRSHAMAGLLPVETSFEQPRLTLGYREVALCEQSPLGPGGSVYRGHEFHFASIVGETTGVPFCRSFDAEGRSLGDAGLRAGNTMGSFVHLMDRHD